MLTIFSHNDLQPTPQQAEAPAESPVQEEVQEVPEIPAKSVQKNFKDEDIKQETINRLKKVLGGLQQPPGTIETAGEQVRSEASSPVTFGRPAAPAGPWPGAPAPPRVMPIDLAGGPQTESRVVEPAASAADAASEGFNMHDTVVELESFAADLTRSFMDALTGVVRQSRISAEEDRKRLTAAVEEMKRSASDIAALASQVAALREQVQSQAQSLAALESVCVTLPAAYQAVEKRLEAQAGAIRAIHAAVQEREDRFTRLLLTLQPAATAPAGSTLPDNL